MKIMERWVMKWRNPGQKEEDGQSVSHEAFQMYQPEEPLQNVVLNFLRTSVACS